MACVTREMHDQWRESVRWYCWFVRGIAVSAKMLSIKLNCKQNYIKWTNICWLKFLFEIIGDSQVSVRRWQQPEEDTEGELIHPWIPMRRAFPLSYVLQKVDDDAFSLLRPQPPRNATTVPPRWSPPNATSYANQRFRMQIESFENAPTRDYSNRSIFTASDVVGGAGIQRSNQRRKRKKRFLIISCILLAKCFNKTTGVHKSCSRSVIFVGSSSSCMSIASSENGKIVRASHPIRNR